MDSTPERMSQSTPRQIPQDSPSSSFQHEDQSNPRSGLQRVPSQEGTTSNFTKDNRPSEEFMGNEIDKEDAECDKIIMALSYRRNKLGCSYYNLTTLKLYLMEDQQEHPPFDLLSLLLSQVGPSAILVSSIADDTFTSALSRLSHSSSAVSPNLSIEIRPNIEFNYSSAKNKLLNIGMKNKRCPQTSDTADNRKDMYLRLSSAINMECEESVSCAGVVLNCAKRLCLEGVEENENDLTLEVLGIEQFSLKNILQINQDALQSLQIFSSESHPNVHLHNHAKESNSLFSLLNFTRTALGKNLLRQWFLRPTLSLPVISSRHRAIECFLSPANFDITEQLPHCLSHIKNTPRILEKMKGKLDANMWQALMKFGYHCLRIRELVKEIQWGREEKVDIIERIKEEFKTHELKDMGAIINHVIDFDGSAKESRIVIKLHVDEELDYMKKTYDGLDDFLSDVATDIRNSIPSQFASLHIIYFPQLGYLIAVPMKSEWKCEKDFVVDGLSYQFSTASTVYYKNNRVRELDEYLGDVHGLIIDREIEIIQKLYEYVKEYSFLLTRCAEACAELDCLLSLTTAARKYKYSSPTMTEENVIRIKRGRHPLQELCVDVFVANDTSLVGGIGIRDDFDSENRKEDADRSIMLLSGANCSGKSVYLKQIALIVYMAHIGSFVPAQLATIGLTDKIFTRVQTLETVSKIQSAFVIDLQQISIAIRNSTERSLLIFDEFGKGTGSTGLFCGVIENLLKRGQGCPKVVVATHFHEIFENKLLDTNLPIVMNAMEIVRDEKSEELTFLYRLVPGRSMTSWGSFCAHLAGIPAAIVTRASHLSQLFARYESVPYSCFSNRNVQEYAKLETIARRFVELDFDNGCDIETFLDLVGRDIDW